MNKDCFALFKLTLSYIMWIDILCALINIVPLLSNFLKSCVTSWRFPFPFVVLHTIFLLFLAIAISCLNSYVFFKNHLLHVCEICSSYMLVFWIFCVEFLYMCSHHGHQVHVLLMMSIILVMELLQETLLKWILQIQPFLMDITTSSQQMFKSWYFFSFCITQI